MSRSVQRRQRQGQQNTPHRWRRANVRAALYTAAFSAKRFNDVIRQFAATLASGKRSPDHQPNLPKVVTTACMRKLLVILNTVIKKDTHWKPKLAPLT